MAIISRNTIIKQETSVFERKCKKMFANLDPIPTVDNTLIKNNKSQIKKFKKKYSFYKSIIKLFKLESDGQDLNYKISKTIVDHLSRVYTTGFVIESHDGVSALSKRKYREEKGSIINDLEKMLFEAQIYNKIRNVKQENRITVKKNKNSNKNGSTLSSDVDKELIRQEDVKRNNKELEDNFHVLKKALVHCKMYNIEKRSFNCTDYNKLQPLQSFQYLLTFFVLEILKKDLDDKELVKTEIFLKFNNSFSIIKNDKPQKMTTQNWNKFRNSRLKKLDESDFYTDLSKELKKGGLLQTIEPDQT